MDFLATRLLNTTYSEACDSYIVKAQQEAQITSVRRRFLWKFLLILLLSIAVISSVSYACYKKFRRKTGREIMQMELQHLDLSMDTDPPQVF